MSRRKTKNATHVEYISTKQHEHGLWWRLSNYFVLLSMVLVNMASKRYNLGFEFSEYTILVALLGVLGYDLFELYDKLKNIKALIGERRKK